MTTTSANEGTITPGVRRRWFLALDPIFEAGRRGKRAKAWDVEDELVAIAIGGDVTIDLSETRSSPARVAIDAYAVLRDVDVIVPAGASVQLFGGVVRGHLRNEVPSPPEGGSYLLVKIHGHCVLGDVNVRTV